VARDASPRHCTHASSVDRTPTRLWTFPRAPPPRPDASVCTHADRARLVASSSSRAPSLYTCSAARVRPGGLLAGTEANDVPPPVSLPSHLAVACGFRGS
jgi:hypothetical protein